MHISKTKLGIAMANKGLNFIELSTLCNVSRATLSYINNGKACRPEILHKIASALNVDVTELLEN